MFEKTAYQVWFLLPLLLSFLGLKSGAKRIFNTRGAKEDTKNYFRQALYCGVIFVAAVYLDKHLIEDLAETLLAGIGDSRIASWLAYPALLVLAAYIQKFFEEKKEEPKSQTKPRVK